MPRFGSGGFPVEDGHPSAVLAWSVGCEEVVACRRACMNPIHKIDLLEEPQIEVGLRHTLQRRRDSTVPPITYIIRTKAYNSSPVPSHLFATPTCMSSYGPSHS